MLLVIMALTATLQADIKTVGTEILSKAVFSGEKPILIDARSLKYDDLKRIPGAIHLPYNSTEAMIFKAIPVKDQPIFIYCKDKDCPASLYLAERLVRLGYTNVTKYTEGIAAWMASGYPVYRD